MNSAQKAVAIVTGAFSGIGLGMALALIKHGYDVVATSRTISESKNVKSAADLVLIDAKANLLTSELRLSYTKIYATVNGEVTNLDVSEGAYASTGEQVLALIDRDSYWVAAYFKETQLRHISTGDTAIISLMGNEDLPFTGTVQSVGWGIFVTDGSAGQGTALLPSVSPTIDWVRLPQRFPVRIQVANSGRTELRMGQTASVTISHGARTENARITSN